MTNQHKLISLIYYEFPEMAFAKGALLPSPCCLLSLLTDAHGSCIASPLAWKFFQDVDHLQRFNVAPGVPTERGECNGPVATEKCGAELDAGGEAAIFALMFFMSFDSLVLLGGGG